MNKKYAGEILIFLNKIGIKENNISNRELDRILYVKKMFITQKYINYFKNTYDIKDENTFLTDLKIVYNKYMRK